MGGKRRPGHSPLTAGMSERRSQRLFGLGADAEVSMGFGEGYSPFAA